VGPNDVLAALCVRQLRSLRAGAFAGLSAPLKVGITITVLDAKRTRASYQNAAATGRT
jgi:hypothetical protein